MSLFPRFQFDTTAAKPAKPAKEEPRFSNFSDFSGGGHAPETYDTPLAELRELAGDDWQELQSHPDTLEAFTHAVQTRRMRESGLRPPHYTQRSECAACGPVWLWEGAPDRVTGCPWCFVRVAGKPIPRPPDGRESMKAISL